MPVLECSRCNELYYSAHGSTELSCDACGGSAWRVFEDEVSFARVGGLERDFQPCDHGALLYTDEAAAVDFCSGYLREGLERAERLMIALPEGLQRALVERLDSAALEDAIVLDSGQLYGPSFDPEGTTGEYERLVKELAEPVRILSGIEGSAADRIAPDTFRRYERLAHQLVLDLGATALCVYDGRRLPIAYPPIAVEGHPLISRNGQPLCRNSDFSYLPA